MVNLQGTFEVPTPGGVVGKGGFQTEPLEDQEGREHPGCCPVKGKVGGTIVVIVDEVEEIFTDPWSADWGQTSWA